MAESSEPTTHASPVDTQQLKNAAQALLDYVKQQPGGNGTKQLIDDTTLVHLVVTLKRIPAKRKSKPIFLPLPHPLYDDQTEVCLITPDPHQPIKEKLKENPIPSVKKVIGLTKLRKNYKTFADRRKLLASYDLFLAYDTVIEFMPSVLGKVFYEKKKHPIPLRVRGPVDGPVKKALGSTFAYLNTGVCLDIRVALSSMTADQITENVLKVLDTLVSKIPRKWTNIQSLQLKVHRSPALPFYASLPVEAGVTRQLAKSYLRKVRAHEAFIALQRAHRAEKKAKTKEALAEGRPTPNQLKQERKKKAQEAAALASETDGASPSKEDGAQSKKKAKAAEKTEKGTAPKKQKTESGAPAPSANANGNAKKQKNQSATTDVQPVSKKAKRDQKKPAVANAKKTKPAATSAAQPQKKSAKRYYDAV